MRALFYFALLGCAFSVPQWYNPQNGGMFREGMNEGGNFGERIIGGGEYSSGGYTTTRRTGGGQTTTRRPGGYTNPGTPGRDCPPGQVPHAGSCDTPDVKKWLYVYGPPETITTVGPPPNIPKPKINFNVVLVHAPEKPESLEPIIVPPPQQKTVVYVLSKDGEEQQQVIEVPAGPKDPPKVLYVNYKEGENPPLPGGFTLQDALSSAISQDSKSIDGHGNGNGNDNDNGNGNGNDNGNDGDEYGQEGESGGNQNQIYYNT